MFPGFNQPKRRSKGNSNSNFIPQGIGIMSGFNSRPAKRKEKTWVQAKRKNPNLNPFGDSDGDRVMNWKDCRPFDKKRQGVYFHGTTSMSDWAIKEEGLKPAKDLNNPHQAEMRTSLKTEQDKVYMFKEPRHARTYAEGAVEQRGMGRPIVVAVDVDDKELERDVEMKFGEAYKKKGMVQPGNIKTYEGNLSYSKEEPVYNYGTPNYVKTAKDMALEEEDDDEEGEDY